MPNAPKTKETTVPAAPETPVPPAPSTKKETRLFQINPTTKEWLTEQQATEKGFFWKK